MWLLSAQSVLRNRDSSRCAFEGLSFMLAVLLQGLSPDPDQVAFREPVTRQPLYRVRFAQSDVWPEYVTGSKDTLDVEIHQHWLDPATPEDLRKQEVCIQFVSWSWPGYASTENLASCSLGKVKSVWANCLCSMSEDRAMQSGRESTAEPGCASRWAPCA